ncbi:acyl-CoA thioesterase [Bacillus tuaregi]|uniref:acyl-CoA thioesterase n=1 Tax=Bacillus tuaregi TaxID=1816695 RepID=UPI0008F86FA2|nr:thioesterase family protein [Bacillus tuaregi]
MEYHFQVRWGETDAAGIVFYPSFYSWMDEASHHYFTEIGYPTTKLYENENIGIPLVEAKCVFKSPLYFGDQVTVESTVSKVRNKVFTINHVFLKEGKMVAEGMEIRAWAALNPNLKAVSIPDEVRNALQQTGTAV